MIWGEETFFYVGSVFAISEELKSKRRLVGRWQK